jgi:hypothetical protein
MLDMAAQDSQRERYKFSQSKTKVMVGNLQPVSGLLATSGRWELEGAALEAVEKQDHLGLVRQRDPVKLDLLIAARIQLGRRSTYAFMGVGVHGLNGLHPLASVRIWDTYVLPRVVHSLEALVIKDTDLEKLDLYHRGTLRRIQHLPPSTSNNAVYLLLGACPIAGIVHRNTLVLFGNLLTQQDSTERAIIQRQLAVKDAASSSWVVHVRKLLQEYDLPSAFTLFKDPPPLNRWKAIVKQNVNAYYNKKLKEKAKIQPSLKYFNSTACQIGKPHPHWVSVGTSKLDISRGTVKAKLLTGSYMLQERVAKRSGGKLTPICLMCRKAREDREHFLLGCSALNGVRKPYLVEIRTLIPEIMCVNIDWCSENPRLIQIIMDCSHPCLELPDNDQPAVEEVTRRLCFALHCERATQLKRLQPQTSPGATASPLPTTHDCAGSP